MDSEYHKQKSKEHYQKYKQQYNQRKDDPEYLAYRERTPVLFPRPPGPV